jgi:hypothetical protein
MSFERPFEICRFKFPAHGRFGSEQALRRVFLEICQFKFATLSRPHQAAPRHPAESPSRYRNLNRQISKTHRAGWRSVHGLAPPPAQPPEVTAAPQTFLLKRLWRKHGLIAPDEVPGA